MGGRSGHGSPTAATSQPAAKKKVLILSIALGEGFVARELTLDGLKRVLRNDDRDGNLHPLLFRPIYAPRFPCRLALIVMDTTGVPFIGQGGMDGRRVPFADTCRFMAGQLRMAIVFARDALLRQQPCNSACRHAVKAQLKDAVDHGCFLLVDLPSPAMVCLDVAVAKGNAPPIHVTGLGPTDEAPLQPLQNFGTFILREGAAHPLLQGMRHDQHPDRRAFEFLREQQLMPQVT